MKIFKENSDSIELPLTGEYIDGSFDLSTDNVEEMDDVYEIVVKIPKADFEKIRWGQADAGMMRNVIMRGEHAKHRKMFDNLTLAR